MITYIQVLDAVNRVNGHREDLVDSPIVRVLVQSLELYKTRKEFDGTMVSAHECLELAGYELESWNKVNYLKAVTIDMVRRGYVTEETHLMGADIPCSEKVYLEAQYRGENIRKDIYRRYNYWDLAQKVSLLKERINRALGCGDRLDTEENISLIVKYHEALEIRNRIGIIVDQECLKYGSE